MSSDAVHLAGRGPQRALRVAAQGAFWFFLLKGLAWLIVPAVLAFAAAG